MNTKDRVIFPTWGAHELEHLNQCPICNSKTRTLKFSEVEDQIYETQNGWNYYACLSCGIYYLDPRPTIETIDRAYENYFTHESYKNRERASWFSQVALGIRNDYLYWKYGREQKPRIMGARWLLYLLPPWLRLEWDHHARHLPKLKFAGARLLDVGCGNGKFLKEAQLAGWQCFGVDFDPQAVEIAKGQGATVMQGTLMEQNFPDDYFDAITLSHVIEHVHCVEELLVECERILKQKGTLWLATPNIDSIIRKWFKKDWLACIPPQHLTLFNQKTLSNLLGKLGFSVDVKRRGVHIQRHYLSSKAFRQGKKGVKDLSIIPYSGSQTMVRFWGVELVVWIVPFLQGDIVIQAVKKTTQ